MFLKDIEDLFVGTDLSWHRQMLYLTKLFLLNRLVKIV